LRESIGLSTLVQKFLGFHFVIDEVLDLSTKVKKARLTSERAIVYRRENVPDQEPKKSQKKE